MKNQLKIAISTRITNAQNYDEKRDSISHEWSALLEKLEFIPILIPNSLKNVEKFLASQKIDGIIMSGGDNIGEDELRDKTEKNILNYSIKNKIPVFGVCRGMQLINKFFNGEIVKTDDKKHVGTKHGIILKNNKIKSKIFMKNILEVNSFHNNIITKNNLGEELEILAVDPNDDSIEAIKHKKLPIIGVMWHPERKSGKDSEFLLKKFFERVNTK